MTQEQIEALIAAYRTKNDFLPSREAFREQQLERGLFLARNGYEIHIAAHGTWSAVRQESPTEPGAVIRSFETLGVSSCTADLLKGWLLGGAPILDRRREQHVLTCRCGIYAHVLIWEERAGKCPRCGDDPLPYIPNPAQASTQNV
jgi:hypothetical protein